jgi:hypothetical protein
VVGKGSQAILILFAERVVLDLWAVWAVLDALTMVVCLAKGSLRPPSPLPPELLYRPSSYGDPNCHPHPHVPLMTLPLTTLTLLPFGCLHSPPFSLALSSHFQIARHSSHS